ncbi:MAG TPA: hypothetical protein VF049_14885 [Nocardioidaceae bacterium]|jgi:hypothetical protein
MIDYGQQRITWRGHRFNRRSVAAFVEVERRLGYRLHIYQGSYNTSVSASAGTHAGGGAVDCHGRGHWRDEVRVMREVGWIAWHRTIPPFDTEHIHAILRGDPDLSPAARDQCRDWAHHLDGLADNGPDPGPRVDVPVFPLRIVPPPPGAPARQLPCVDLTEVRAAFHQGATGRPRSAVKRVQRALNARVGAGLEVDGVADRRTQAAYRAWQRSLGYRGDDADGIPGHDSLAALGRRRWRVVG